MREKNEEKKIFLYNWNEDLVTLLVSIYVITFYYSLGG